MELMSGKMTSKGQITIPKELRELLRVKEGDQLLFLVEKNTIKIEPVRLYAEKNVDFADALLSVKSSSTLPVLTWDKKDFKRLNCE